jgi:hypothetical protein
MNWRWSFSNTRRGGSGVKYIGSFYGVHMYETIDVQPGTIELRPEQRARLYADMQERIDKLIEGALCAPAPYQTVLDLRPRKARGIFNTEGMA